MLVPAVATFVAVTAWVSRPNHIHEAGNPYHTRVFMSAYGGLPDTMNSLFTGSGKCAGCHATDPNSIASIAGQTYPAVAMPDGHDVNPTDMWRSSIMANSAKDPFWRAKVSHEVIINPDHQVLIEDKCTSCHAPLGNFGSKHAGVPHYSIEMLLQDSLALDGVSCVACHQQSADSSGILFSGKMAFDSAVIYGPYGIGKDEPPIYDLPMLTYTFYNPIYGQHMVESTVCADCHTLITNTADLEGNLTGDEYVEQATYHEWVNSAFSGEGVELPEEAEGQEGTCQSCHMARIDDPVIISSGYAFLEPRTPYGLHQLAGANLTMLEIMRDNIETLGLTASEAQFDSTIFWTREMLQDKTLDLSVTQQGLLDEFDGTPGVQIKLTNKAGHKFPSGYPARRAFIELIVHIADTDTLFHSGKLDASGARIIGSDEAGLTAYEPHYDVIDSDDKVQIYEIVATDVEMNPTNVLERAAHTVKDNRLIPLGFSMNHPSYDTTKVEGEALMDPNFNITDSGEPGSGSDRITYLFPELAHIDISEVDVTVNVWYQSMPPRWVEGMFDYSDQSESIAFFQELYEDHGAKAELVESLEFTINLIDGVDELSNDADIVLMPNPTSDGLTTLKFSNLGSDNVVYELYNAVGSRVQAGSLSGRNGQLQLELPAVRGVYVLKVHDGGSTIVRRVVRN